MESVENDQKVGFASTLFRWVEDYSSKKEMGLKQYVVSKLGESLTDLGEEKRAAISDEIAVHISKYEDSKAEIQAAIDSGKSKEEWLSDTLQKATEDLDEQQKTETLGTLHEGLMSAMGIEQEEASVNDIQEELPLENKMIANSISNLVTGRTMQSLADESLVEEEEVGSSEFVEEALKNHSDTELKTLASGALISLHRMGRLKILPPTTPIGAIVNIACFGVDHARTVVQMAKKEISFTEGLRRIARDSFAAIRGILMGTGDRMDKDGILGAIPILQKPLALVNKISKGITDMIGSEVVQQKITAVRERIIPAVQSFAREFISKTVSVVRTVASRIKNWLFG